MLLLKVLRIGVQKYYQKSYELQTGSQEFTVDFKGCERQFDQLKISLVYDKSDKHLTIYGSYNAKCAAKIMKSIELANISDICSAKNRMIFNTSNNNQKHMLWKQYVTWHCDGYSTAPFSDYINNPAFQKLLLESDYFGNKYDERVYIDLRDDLGHANEIEKSSTNDSKLNLPFELKNALTHKMRLRV